LERQACAIDSPEDRKIYPATVTYTQARRSSSSISAKFAAAPGLVARQPIGR
jgi:hypothetical protein